MKTLLPLALTLALQSVVTAVAAVLGLDASRPEPAIAVITFTAARLDPLAGALTCSAIGYATDLMALSPPGLHMLSFTLAFLISRALSEVLGMRRASSALLLVAAVSVAFRLIMALLMLMFDDLGARGADLGGQSVGVLLDAAIAAPIWMLMERLYRWAAGDTEDARRRL